MTVLSSDGSTRVGVAKDKAGSKSVVRIDRTDGTHRTIELNAFVFQNCLQVSRSGRWLAVRGETLTGGILPVRIFDLHGEELRRLRRSIAMLFIFIFAGRESAHRGRAIWHRKLLQHREASD